MAPAGPTPADERFTRAHRLLKKSEFDAVFSGGRKFVRPLIVVYALPRPDGCGESRLGLVSSRRVGKATVRNRRRRQIRELFRRHRQMLKNPIDLVVVFRQTTRPVKFEDLSAGFVEVLQKLASASVKLPGGPSPESLG